MKLTKFNFLLLFCFILSLRAGWGPEAHKNLLTEAIRILPIFDYEMCVYYKSPLITGIIEGEIQFKYKDNGVSPNWIELKNPQELVFLNGIHINKKNYDKAADFFANKFSALRNDIINCRRKYSDVLYELGYYLTAINNMLIPLYEKGNFPEQKYAKQTANLILESNEIVKIKNIKYWCKNTFTNFLNLRESWTKSARTDNLDEFKKLSHKANTSQIYALANIISFILSDSFGPGHPDARKHVQKIHEKHINVVNGRKPIF